MKYLQILFETNIPQYSSESTLRAARDYWEKVINGYTVGAELQSGFQTAMFHWCFIETGPALIESAIIVVVVGLVASFIVILLGTANFFMALYVFIFMGGILVCDLAILGLFKWEYDTLQAIMCIVVFGFVTRFLFLVAYGYYKEGENKKERTSNAMKFTGPFIFHSSIATVGSVIFIYLCVLLLLEKFGVIICFTILYSFLSALLFLPSMLFILGPQKGCGNIGCLRAAEKDDEDSEDVKEDQEDRMSLKEQGREKQEDDVESKRPKESKLYEESKYLQESKVPQGDFEVVLSNEADQCDDMSDDKP